MNGNLPLYKVRPSYKSIAYSIISNKFPKMRTRYKRNIVEESCMIYSRWLRYFTYEQAEEYLMPEDAIEEIVEVDEDIDLNNIGI